MIFKKHLISREQAKDFFTNSYSHFIEIDGMNIHYRIEGEGEPLLLIHGFGASLHNWDPVVPQLSKKHKVIRLDIPGFGLSSTKEGIAIPDIVKVLNIFVEKLSLEKVSIAGSSMGGWIAWEFAVAFPGTVDKLILMNAAGFFDETKAPTQIIAQKERLINFLIKRGVPRFAVKRILKNAVGGDKSVLKKDYLNQFYNLVNIDGNLKNIKQYAMEEINPTIDRLSSIENKTLILWGSEDKVMPLKYGKQFNKEIENSDIIVYKGVGHIPMVEVPNKVANDIQSFLTPSLN